MFVPRAKFPGERVKIRPIAPSTKRLTNFTEIETRALFLRRFIDAPFGLSEVEVAEGIKAVAREDRELDVSQGERTLPVPSRNAIEADMLSLFNPGARFYSVWRDDRLKINPRP